MTEFRNSLNKVGIMMPVRDRGRILPFTLDRILHQDIGLESIGIKFLVNDSEDNSVELIDEFINNNGKDMYKCNMIEMTCNKEKDERCERRQNDMFHHMAFLKTVLFNSMMNDDYDFIMYMDSDILLGSDVIRRLSEYCVEICAPMLDVTMNHYNYFFYDNRSKQYNRVWNHKNKVFIADYVCGCYMISKRMFDIIKFGHEGQLGDDDTLMRICREKRVRIYVIPGLDIKHIYDIDSFLVGENNG